MGAAKARGFLNEREIRMCIARVNIDRGDAVAEKFNWKKFLGAGTDLKIWGFAWIFGMTTTVSYALAYFLPIILRVGMGFDVGKSQCLVAPPYGFAGIWMYFTGWYGDKKHLRGPIILVNSVICIIGLPLIGWVDNVGVRYFGVFLVCAGANANIPACMTYQANNIRGHWKRAFCSATLLSSSPLHSSSRKTTRRSSVVSSRSRALKMASSIRCKQLNMAWISKGKMKLRLYRTLLRGSVLY